MLDKFTAIEILMKNRNERIENENEILRNKLSEKSFKLHELTQYVDEMKSLRQQVDKRYKKLDKYVM